MHPSVAKGNVYTNILQFITGITPRLECYPYKMRRKKRGKSVLLSKCRHMSVMASAIISDSTCNRVAKPTIKNPLKLNIVGRSQMASNVGSIPIAWRHHVTWHRVNAGTAAEDFAKSWQPLCIVWLAKKWWSWWRRQMETFPAFMALCAGNSPVTGESPSHKPVTRSFDVFLGLHLNKGLNKRSRRRWFETSSRSLWRHCNVKETSLIP